MSRATAADIAELRAKIEAREKGEAEARRELPGGIRVPMSHVLTGCPTCGRWAWMKPAFVGTNCAFCNPFNYVDGGMIRAATKKETNAWIAREKEKDAQWTAEAPKRRAAVDAFNRQRAANEKDGRHDLAWAGRR